jgi:type II secretory pathway predicted ATPase ExeA
MYLSHFKLSSSPFSGRGPHQHFFACGTHQEALARLEFLVANRRTLGLLLGPMGIGKSIIVRKLAERLGRQGCYVAKASLVGLTGEELLSSLINQLGCGDRQQAHPVRLWRRLGDRLAEFRALQKRVVFLLDDLDLASEELQSFVIRLVSADAASDACHTLIAACDVNRLGVVSERILHLVDLRVDLDAWSEAETGAYLKAALAKAGCDTAVFDDEAVKQIHGLSDGIPRQVNRLADLALVAAAGQRTDHIDGETVAAVAGELVAC